MAFQVTYNGNGNTGGQAPVDNNSYNAGDTVPVLPPQFPWPGITSQPANTVAGTLVRANGSFGMWNTQADESGTWFYWPAGGASFQINASVTLWLCAILRKWTGEDG